MGGGACGNMPQILKICFIRWARVKKHSLSASVRSKTAVQIIQASCCLNVVNLSMVFVVTDKAPNCGYESISQWIKTMLISSCSLQDYICLISLCILSLYQLLLTGLRQPSVGPSDVDRTDILYLEDRERTRNRKQWGVGELWHITEVWHVLGALGCQGAPPK